MQVKSGAQIDSYTEEKRAPKWLFFGLACYYWKSEHVKRWSCGGHHASGPQVVKKPTISDSRFQKCIGIAITFAIDWSNKKFLGQT